MSDALKKKLLDTLLVAVWVGGSALIAFFLGELLKMPELSAWYGLINVVLFALNEARKR